MTTSNVQPQLKNKAKLCKLYSGNGNKNNIVFDAQQTYKLCTAAEKTCVSPITADNKSILLSFTNKSEFLLLF